MATNYTTADVTATKFIDDESKENLDSFFIIVISIIIIFMQCGFAFLEAGTVRSKNTTSILLKNILDCFIACLVYWGFGYPLAFGEGNFIIGHTYWFGTFPEEKKTHWFYHFVVAATACTIVSGGVAERCNFWPYLIFSFIMTGFIYPVVSRWAWYSNGWLVDGVSVIEGVSYQDYAGSGVVHLTGGIAALIGAYLCGPRIGRFELGSRNPIAGHSVPLSSLGAFVLIFGFLAFNGGSQGSISNKGDGKIIARSVVNTIMAGSAGALTNVFVLKIFGLIQQARKIGLSRWSLLTTINGALVGMVAICSSCNVVDMWAALFIGTVASFIYFFVSLTLAGFKIDDPLDAVAVHAGGGMWGVLATPLFDNTDGIFYSPGEMAGRAGKQLAINLIGALVITGWSATCSVLVFGILSLTKQLRIPPDMELKGMDKLKHGEPAYPISAWQEAWQDVLLTNLQVKQSNNTLPSRPVQNPDPTTELESINETMAVDLD